MRRDRSPAAPAGGHRAVLAEATAARLHGLDGFADIERIIVMIPDRARVRVRDDGTVVRAKQIDVRDVTAVRGIPTLDLAATLVSLARVGHSGRAQGCDTVIDDVLLAIRKAERLRQNGTRDIRD